jgi:hypothetical protein
LVDAPPPVAAMTGELPTVTVNVTTLKLSRRMRVRDRHGLKAIAL